MSLRRRPLYPSELRPHVPFIVPGKPFAANVPSEVGAFAVDPFHSLVRAADGRREIVSAGGNTQHTPAGGFDAVHAQARSGVEHYGAKRLCVRNSADGFPGIVTAGIAGRCHHHADARARAPFETRAAQPASRRSHNATPNPK